MCKRIRVTALIIIFTLLMIVSTGCWDNQDITERAFVSAVGLDKGENNKVQMTLQIIKPNTMKTAQGSTKDEKNFWVFTTEGDTIFEAIRNQLQTVNRKPFYGHVRLIVIGEELAKEGINKYLDFFERDHETKMTPRVIIVKGARASEILTAESELEDIPAMHIEGILDNNIAEAKTRNLKLIDIVQEMTFQNPNLVIGNIIIKNYELPHKVNHLQVEGASIFNKDVLIGYLDSTATRGYLFIKNEYKGGIINIDNPLEKGKKVAIEVKDASSKTDVLINEDELILRIEIKLRSSIGEQEGTGDLSTEIMLQKLEKSLDKEIRKSITIAIEEAQKKYKLDVFAFSEIIYRKHPEYWKDIKDNWNQIFTELPVEIVIDSSIDRTGMITYR